MTEPMTESRCPVIVGDHDLDRSNWLSKFLREFYNVAAETADTFDKVRQMARRAEALCGGGSIIFLADTLPFTNYNRQAFTPNNFSQLSGIDPKARLVCVVTGDDYPNLSGVPAQVTYINLPSPLPTEKEAGKKAAGKKADEVVNSIITSLKPHWDVLPLVNVTLREVVRLTGWDARDRTLREQIRSLSLRRELKDGEQHLHRILRNCLDFREVEAVRVESLTQGKSGALVFRISVTPKSEATAKRGARVRPRDYALKLSRTEEIWKLTSEVSGYLQAAAETEISSPYKAHLPKLHAPRVSKAASEPGPTSEEFKHIASSLPWDAIYYDFLGGSLGEFVSLDTALRAGPARLRKATSGEMKPKFSLASDSPSDVAAFRVNFLQTLLDALCKIWYLNGAFVARKVKHLWSGKDAHDRRYDPLPPYQLTERTKRWVHEFLDSDEAAIGPRLFAEWDDCRVRLLNLIDKGPRGKLAERVPVTLSPVHGDLNAGNAFLWLRHENFPFLIDLPFYQREGHVLQDFARLEAEVKFVLMDRQEESPAELLAAYDYTPQQVPLWRELEDHFLNGVDAGAAEPDWRAPGYRANVSLAHRLVRLIRERAERAQQQPCPAYAAPPHAFMDEYLPALLYHTVRAATYPSLSLFKRMLAVYSAGMILKRLSL